jgi:hypothetical protein
LKKGAGNHFRIFFFHSVRHRKERCFFLFAGVKLLNFFRIGKKYRLCPQSEGPFSMFRYIFHAIHLLAI